MQAPPPQSSIPLILQVLALFVAAMSAFFAIKAYWQNTRTKTAEFLTGLHQSFFIEPTYKTVREVLDERLWPEAVAALVTEEKSDFTDFLNFFEFVAYMQKRGSLSAEHVEALLGYYLRILRDNATVYGYICKEDNSFQHLKKLLTELSLSL